MGRESDDLSRSRAGASGVWSCRRGGRSCRGGSNAALAVAAICASRPGRDQESRQSAADQTQLTNRDLYCCAATKKKLSRLSLNALVTDFLEYPMTRARREPTSSLSARHPPGRPAFTRS